MLLAPQVLTVAFIYNGIIYAIICKGFQAFDTGAEYVSSTGYYTRGTLMLLAPQVLTVAFIYNGIIYAIICKGFQAFDTGAEYVSSTGVNCCFHIQWDHLCHYLQRLPGVQRRS
jgi:hypothetical protein